MKLGIKIFLVILVSLVLIAGTVFSVTKLRFFFPVQVAGALAVLMDGVVADFNSEHPDIFVEPIYSGNYDQTMQKAVTAAQGKNPPDVALLLAIDIFSLLDMNLIEDMDQFMVGEDANFTEPFYAGFLEKFYDRWRKPGVYRSREVLRSSFTKDHFREVGLDPEIPRKLGGIVEAAKS
jgi:sn-glycerol 3-phosphate transport system substrate-binding protein